jgi:DNA-binding NarL/FixJ family response regulator
LLIESGIAEPPLLPGAPFDRCEIRTAGSLRDALRQLGRGDWRPDLVVAALDLPDSQGVATIDRLQAAAPGLPLIVGTESVVELLRRHGNSLGSISGREREDSLAMLRALLQQQQAFHQIIVSHRTQILGEIERAAEQAAAAVVNRAVDQLVTKLHLDDAEGLQLAVRFARGWESAKQKFLAAIATGIASALLVALGAGLVAMLRTAPAR